MLGSSWINLEAARRLVGEVFEFELDREVAIPGRLDSAFYRCGDTSIELIEVVDPAERSRRLGDGTARIEHMGPIRSLVTRADTTKGVTYQIFESTEAR